MYPHACTIIARTAGVADANGETPWTWPTTGTASACEFYDPRDPGTRALSGEGGTGTLWCKIPPTVAITPEGHRILTTQTGYAGTYRFSAVIIAPGLNGAVHHYEAELAEVPA